MKTSSTSLSPPSTAAPTAAPIAAATAAAMPLASNTDKTQTSQKPTKEKNETTQRAAVPIKKRTWKKPAGKPKRPLSAYNLFFREEREKIIALKIEKLTKEGIVPKGLIGDAKSVERKRRPKLPEEKIGFAALTREIADKWKKADEKAKAPFEARAKEEKDRYEVELKKWVAGEKEKKKKEQEAEKDRDFDEWFKKKAETRKADVSAIDDSCGVNDGQGGVGNGNKAGNHHHSSKIAAAFKAGVNAVTSPSPRSAAPPPQHHNYQNAGGPPPTLPDWPTSSAQVGRQPPPPKLAPLPRHYPNEKSGHLPSPNTTPYPHASPPPGWDRIRSDGAIARRASMPPGGPSSDGERHQAFASEQRRGSGFMTGRRGGRPMPNRWNSNGPAPPNAAHDKYGGGGPGGAPPSHHKQDYRQYPSQQAKQRREEWSGRDERIYHQKKPNDNSRQSPRSSPPPYSEGTSASPPSYRREGYGQGEGREGGAPPPLPDYGRGEEGRPPINYSWKGKPVVSKHQKLHNSQDYYPSSREEKQVGDHQQYPYETHAPHHNHRDGRRSSLDRSGSSTESSLPPHYNEHEDQHDDDDDDDRHLSAGHHHYESTSHYENERKRSASFSSDSDSDKDEMYMETVMEGEREDYSSSSRHKKQKISASDEYKNRRHDSYVRMSPSPSTREKHPTPVISLGTSATLVESPVPPPQPREEPAPPPVPSSSFVIPTNNTANITRNNNSNTSRAGSTIIKVLNAIGGTFHSSCHSRTSKDIFADIKRLDPETPIEDVPFHLIITKLSTRIVELEDKSMRLEDDNIELARMLAGRKKRSKEQQQSKNEMTVEVDL